MTTLIIIGIIIIIVIVVKGNKKPTGQEAIYTNLKIRQKSEKEIHDELVQNLVKNIKITVTTTNGTSSYNDDSIIDVTDQTYNIKSDNDLKNFLLENKSEPAEKQVKR